MTLLSVKETGMNNYALACVVYYVLVFSAWMDLALWFGWFSEFGGLHYVPSWTVSGLAWSFGLLLLGFSARRGS